MIKNFENASVYAYGKEIIKTSVAFGERITEIGDGAKGQNIPLPQGALVVPAFIDMHVHGADGADFMDGTQPALERIDGALAREGTARYLATTMTQSAENIKKALNASAQFKKGSNGLLGVHLEGPFISPHYLGAQPADFVAEPDESLFEEFNAAAGGCIKTVTIAPEWETANSFIKYAKDRGISVSLGHTSASNAQIRRAMAAGADAITHTFNAQSGIHHRDIGTAGSALLYDELHCELIADGIHVSYPAIRLLLKCKPKDKVILITDAMRAKGLNDGESELGGQKVFVKDGQARLADGTLAGSVLKMNDAVKNLVKFAGVPIAQAVDFASLNPAKYLGLTDLGKIEKNYRSDFTVLDNNFSVILTVRDGEIIYQR